MKKIKVSICVGTACYVMGASDLLLLEEELPPHLKDLVEIEGILCLDLCKQSNNSKPPFVKLNDVIISNACLTDVIEKIEELAMKNA